MNAYCNYNVRNCKRNGAINLAITCFFIIPYQLHAHYKMDEKINNIELLLKNTNKGKE
jgi:hypothetical protein